MHAAAQAPRQTDWQLVNTRRALVSARRTLRRRATGLRLCLPVLYAELSPPCRRTPHTCVCQGACATALTSTARAPSSQTRLSQPAAQAPHRSTPAHLSEAALHRSLASTGAPPRPARRSCISSTEVAALTGTVLQYGVAQGAQHTHRLNKIFLQPAQARGAVWAPAARAEQRRRPTPSWLPLPPGCPAAARGSCTRALPHAARAHPRAAGPVRRTRSRRSRKRSPGCWMPSAQTAALQPLWLHRPGTPAGAGPGAALLSVLWCSGAALPQPPGRPPSATNS